MKCAVHVGEYAGLEMNVALAGRVQRIHTDGMIYTRGAADDFDRCVNLTGDDGWSWDRVFPYFLKNEKWTAPADHHDTSGQFNSAIHGTDGPISVSLARFSWPVFDHHVIQTTKELPNEFPFNEDMNSGKPLGFGMLCVETRQRHIKEQAADLWRGAVPIRGDGAVEFLAYTGPFVDGVATHAGWLRLTADSPALAAHTDLSSGPDVPHLELTFKFNPGGTIPGPGYFINIGVALLSPVSRCSVTINSSDPIAPPLINPGYLEEEFDVLALVNRFISAPVRQGSPTADLGPAKLQASLRSNAAPAYHLAGTGGMSPRAAQYGVVDPDLCVKGVVGLGVINASVLPILSAAHTQAATYMVAERGADLVKHRWV
ncbi:hypothetical protein C8R44DRAFT_903857 [Mycena epipterygia]|nr:hypothetical protein C8R44DRAFT_903857 [Mycena epipterygia]